MKKLRLILFLFIAVAVPAFGQSDDGVMRMNEFRNAPRRNLIRIPGFSGFQALKCDFHMHTVFSDGHVWPAVRVQEAWLEGLDVISITDHVEYTPYSQDVIVNHNRPYELVKDAAAENNIILIKGTEITRNTPPGHFNAIFVDDVSGYVEDRETNDLDRQAVEKASAQNAFVFWNHPGWKVNQIEGSYEWLDFVDDLKRDGMLHGIEVFNGFGFHKKALDWCVDHNLTVLGSSDIHNLVKHDYKLGDHVHRTMTLVFAKERTPESVREALVAGRTVAWASKYIAGKEEHVRNLFLACIEMGPRFLSKNNRDYYEMKNNSDLYFELQLNWEAGKTNITLYPGSSQIVTLPAGTKSIECEVLTAFVRGDKNLVVNLPLN
jgi:3',5'-nucleoside bisphosphate phosphatase